MEQLYLTMTISGSKPLHPLQKRKAELPAKPGNSAIIKA